MWFSSDWCEKNWSWRGATACLCAENLRVCRGGALHFLQLPWLLLFPPQLSVPWVRWAQIVKIGRDPKMNLQGEPRWAECPDWTEGCEMISGQRECGSGFPHFLGLGGILVSWNPDFGHLGVCRKAGTQEIKGSHYSPPNFQLFWHKTGILIIFSLILQFFGSAHTTNLLHHVRKEEELSHLNVWTHLGFFLMFLKQNIWLFSKHPYCNLKNPSIFNLVSDCQGWTQ